jgi:chromosome segregation ATPase
MEETLEEQVSRLEQERESIVKELATRERTLRGVEGALAAARAKLERLTDARRPGSGFGARALSLEAYRVELRRKIADLDSNRASAFRDVERARERLLATDNDLMVLREESDGKL